MTKITTTTRGYKSEADRKRAIAAFRRAGFNHFVAYRDTQATFALQFGRANWLPAGRIYVAR